MIAILKRELKAYFTSVIGWIFMAAFFFVFKTTLRSFKAVGTSQI